MLKAVVLVKFYKGELNPFDGAALECALKLGGLDITVISMSPMASKEKLGYLTRLGINRAILLSDEAYAGSDTLATSKVLTAAIKKIEPNLVICGRQSVDGDTAQVPAQVAAMLGYNLITDALEFNLQKINTRLCEKNVNLPCVISMEKVVDLRFASIRSKTKDVEIWDNSYLKIPQNECGLNGSPTKVLKVFPKEKSSKQCKFIKLSELDEAIKQALKKDFLAIGYKDSQNKLDTVHIVGNSLHERASKISKNVVVIEEKDKQGILQKIKQYNAKFVLFNSDLYYRSLAPQIAAELNCGLCADCTELETDGKKMFMYRPALSGDVIAKIECMSDITMATVRESEVKSNKIVFGIGVGAVQYIGLIKELAKKYNAELCASRKAVDMGICEYSCQVGLTGKVISPKVYVAFGISGKVHHIVGIERANTVIAINNDKNAKIFDNADIGIVDNIHNLREL